MDGVYVGQMSGTSMDGVDTALVRFRSSNSAEILKTRHDPFPETVARSLKSLFSAPDRESRLASIVDAQLADCYAEAVCKLLAAESFESISAIGCHGQTILHCPHADPPFSWQVGDPAAVARRTQIPVVADFRAADLAAGGHGAPLAPAFHRSHFALPGRDRVIVNIGGISNITCIPGDPQADVFGFDTGPGNALSDQWIRRHLDLPYDDSGQWANSAATDKRLLDCLLGDPYFDLPAPKSLDARYFSMQWLDRAIADAAPNAEPEVVQSTLAAFTANSIAKGVRMRMRRVDEIYVCGGGAHNQAIMDGLRACCAAPVESTASLGMPPDYVEAAAFAWLAYCNQAGLPSNLPSVTGAGEHVVLGRVWNP